MADFKNTNITLKGLEDKGKTMTVIDTNDTKFSIWKNDYKNPAMSSEPFESLLNFKIGETFGISYGEKAESFVNNEGKTINFTRRTIYSIIPPLSNPPPVAKTPHSGANTASQSNLIEPKDDKFWDMKAYKQCLWNFWLESQMSNKVLPSTWKDMVWTEFKNIEADSKKRFFEFDKPAEPSEELPVIQQKEDLGEDIPF